MEEKPDGIESPETDVSEVVDQQPPEVAPDSQSPWANDLQQLFEDEGVRGNVDAFLREKVQPYITKIEQESAADRRAKNLWDQFTEDPYDTFERVAEEIYGEDAREKIRRALSDNNESDEYEPEAAEDSDDDPVFDLNDLPREVRELVQRTQEQESQQLFEQEMDQVREYMTEENIPFDEEVFYPFVSANDGDIEDAVEAYQKWVGKAGSTFGLKFDAEPDQVESPAPPPAINSGSRQTAPPPQAEKYSDLGSAVDAWLQEENAPPPVVGNA